LSFKIPKVTKKLCFTFIKVYEEYLNNLLYSMINKFWSGIALKQK